MTMLLVRLIVCGLLLSVSLMAQAVGGHVVSVMSHWSLNTFGDQKIVSDVVVETDGQSIIAEVEGGTIDGLTLEVSDVRVPKVGARVRVAHTHGRWRLTQEDFTPGASQWPGAEIAWLLDAWNADMDPALAERDIVAAATTWNDTPANLTMRYAGRIGNGAGVQALDYQNVVLFRPTASPSGGALASTYCWWTGPTRLDCDAINWDAAVLFWPSSGGCSGLNAGYLLDIMTHEFGHVFGLDHSTVPEATMYPSYPYCSTATRSLADDDLAGALSLYPPLSEPGPSPEPTPDTDPTPPPCKKRGHWAC